MESPKLQTLDITVDENDIAGGALIILKTLRPQWKETDIKFMNFTEGITNKLIGCYHSSDKEKEDAIVMRIYGAKTELLIDREKELINMQILHAAGCAAPCYARFNNGIAYGFVSGTCLDEHTVRSPEIYKCITRSVAALHLIDPSSLILSDGKAASLDTAPCLFTKCRRYLSLIPDSLLDPNKNEQLKKDLPSKETLAADLDRMEEALTKLGSPSVFSHNDLLLKNIVYNKAKGTATFIDYEYGAYNFEASDIGNHFAEWAGVDDLDFARYPSREEQLPWLRSYLEHKADLSGDKTPVTDKDVEKLYAQANKFALMGHFFWGVWGLIQSSISTIDFDYLGYAKLKLDEFYKRRDEFLAIEMPE